MNAGEVGKCIGEFQEGSFALARYEANSSLNLNTRLCQQQIASSSFLLLAIDGRDKLDKVPDPEVFHTTDSAKGWDGYLKGERQDMNVFAWICSYQLQGEKQEQRKETVILIR